MKPESEHWHIGFPHRMGEFLVSVELKHDFLDELQHSNNVLFTLHGLIFYILSHIGEKTLSALSVKYFELPFQVLFQYLLSVNEFLF